MKNRFRDELYNRCLNLTIQVIRFTSSIKLNYELNGIKKQLVNCTSSIGANFTEGNGAVSKIEFIKFMNHSRKSNLEALYWFDVIIKSELLSEEEISKAKELKQECEELVKIFTKIILTSKENIRR